MSNHLAVAANRDQLRNASECADRLRQRRLLVGGLVLVDDTLRDGLVELARRLDEGDRRGVLVATGDGLTDATDVRLELGLHRLVAQARLLVGGDALDLGLDVGHVGTLLCVRRSDLTGLEGAHSSGTGAWGHPRRGTGLVPADPGGHAKIHVTSRRPDGRNPGPGHQPLHSRRAAATWSNSSRSITAPSRRNAVGCSWTTRSS